MWKEHPEWDLNKDGVVDFVLLKGEPGHPDAEARTKYVVEKLNADGIKTKQLAVGHRHVGRSQSQRHHAGMVVRYFG